MNPERLQHRLDDIFDQALVFHSYAKYMRDYDVVVYCTADPKTGITPDLLRYRFKLCVSARVETAVSPAVWARSLDERLVAYESGVNLDGYVWGVNWQEIYPGASVVENSAVAARWAAELGVEFHEVNITANAHNLNLVFSDLDVTEVAPGHAPYVAGDGGPDGKFPLL